MDSTLHKGDIKKQRFKHKRRNLPVRTLPYMYPLTALKTPTRECPELVLIRVLSSTSHTVVKLQ